MKFETFVSENFNADKLRESLLEFGIIEDYGEYMLEESCCHYLCSQLSKFQDFENSKAKLRCHERLKNQKEMMENEMSELDRPDKDLHEKFTKICLS